MDLAIQNRIRLCNTKYIVQKIGAKGVQGQAYLDLGRAIRWGTLVQKVFDR